MADIADKPQNVHFAPRRLAHANIFVRDLKESLAFYSAVCGLTEVFAEPAVDMVFLSNGSSHHDVALMQIARKDRGGRDGRVATTRGSEPGLNHLGWEMENEKVLVDAYKRAVGLDVDVKRTTDHGMSHSVYLFDPERNFQEFYSDQLVDWREFYRNNVGQAISGSWDPLASEPSTAANYDANFSPEYVKSAPVQPREISRAGIIAEDFDKMLRFYRDVGGLSLAHLDEAVGVAVLMGTTGKPALSLFAQREGEQTGLHHIGFEVVNEIELETLHGDLRRINNAAPVEITDGRGKKGVVLKSPDGILLEFFLPTPGRAWSAEDARAPRDLFIA